MINIRKERPEDERRVEEIDREAFWSLYFPGCHEHYAIHQLRKHEDYLRELSWVIEMDGDLAGGIFFSKSKIVGRGVRRYVSEEEKRSAAESTRV